MNEIVWESTRIIQPTIKPIQSFIQENKIKLHESSYCEDSLFFIEHEALKGLYDFLAHDISREHGGVLVGLPFFDEEQEKLYVDIRVAIPAQESEGSPVYFKFTSNTWKNISGIIEENFPEMLIVGWYHSHPGLGVFMSGTDRDTQHAFYNQSWNFAIVVDPIKKETGWFSGLDCIPIQQDQLIIYSKEREFSSYDARTLFDKEKISSALEKLMWLLPLTGILLFTGILSLWLLRRKAS